MKEFYGDSVLYNNINNLQRKEDNIELFDTEDTLSARTLNRPIRELKEELDKVKLELANLDKKIYGRKKPSNYYASIASGIFEEFDPKKVCIGTLKTGKQYIRIPTGVINCFYKRDDEIEGKYWKWPEDGEGFQRVQNYPKIELFERELGDCFNIDLHNQFNDIKVNYNLDKKSIYYNVTVNTVKESRDFDTGNIVCKKDTRIIKKISEFENADNSNSSDDRIKNVFDVVKAMDNNYKNYLTKNTDNFSLEEIINTDGLNGEYSIYITPKNKNIRFVDNSNNILNIPENFTPDEELENYSTIEQLEEVIESGENVLLEKINTIFDPLDDLINAVATSSSPIDISNNESCYKAMGFVEMLKSYGLLDDRTSPDSLLELFKYKYMLIVSIKAFKNFIFEPISEKICHNILYNIENYNYSDEFIRNAYLQGHNDNLSLARGDGLIEGYSFVRNFINYLINYKKNKIELTILQIKNKPNFIAQEISRLNSEINDNITYINDNILDDEETILTNELEKLNEDYVLYNHDNEQNLPVFYPLQYLGTIKDLYLTPISNEIYLLENGETLNQLDPEQLEAYQQMQQQKPLFEELLAKYIPSYSDLLEIFSLKEIEKNVKEDYKTFNTKNIRSKYNEIIEEIIKATNTIFSTVNVELNNYNDNLFKHQLCLMENHTNIINENQTVYYEYYCGCFLTSYNKLFDKFYRDINESSRFDESFEDIVPLIIQLKQLKKLNDDYKATNMDVIYSNSKKFFMYKKPEENEQNVYRPEAIELYNFILTKDGTEIVDGEVHKNPNIIVESEELDNIEILNAAVGTAWCSKLNTLDINTKRLVCNGGELLSDESSDDSSFDFDGIKIINNSDKIKIMKRNNISNKYEDANLIEVIAGLVKKAKSSS